MRRIYLARHGAIEKPGTGSYCLGRTDWPLSDEGRGQAALLRAWFEDMPGLSARTSPLARCRETARIALEKDAPAEPRLAELDMGEWDGLSFAEIRERWPEEYRLRGESLCAHVPPGAEAPEAALERALPLLDAPGATRAFFTHAGVLRLLRCRLEARPLDEMLSVPADYVGVSLLVEDASGWRAAGWNVRPAKTPSADESAALLAQLPEHIAAHCRAVQALALEMTDALAAGGTLLDRGLVSSAALLHDICRLQPRHAEAGAQRLASLGYRALADAVRTHHDWRGETLDEAGVLFLADKYIQDAQRVTLAERFFKSAQRCETDEARRAHEARFQQAICAEALYLAKIGG